MNNSGLRNLIIFCIAICSFSCVSTKSDFTQRKYLDYNSSYRQAIQNSSALLLKKKTIINEMSEIGFPSPEIVIPNTIDLPIDSKIDFSEIAFTDNYNSEVELISVVSSDVITKPIIVSSFKSFKDEILPIEIKKNKAHVDPLLKTILAIFIPPLAVFLHVGLRDAFWLNLILTLFFFVPGVIHALLVVLDII